MKTILLLIFISAATAQAQYSSEWGEFNGGHASQTSATATNGGMLLSWLRIPMLSADYESQQGLPEMPIPVQTSEAPMLSIELAGNNVLISWPAPATGFVLQHKESVELGVLWDPIAGPYPQVGDEFHVLVPTVDASRFYRLMLP